MTKVLSVVLITRAIFAAAFFGGRQAVFSTNNHSGVAAAAPASLQSLEGTWYLKKDGKPAQTRKMTGTTSSDTASQCEASVAVWVYRKEGGRSSDLLTIVEYELKEQYSGKGKFRTVYAGILSRDDSGRITGGRGTYHNNDGESGDFELSKTQ